MSSLMEVLVDGEYELVVEALSRLRQIKVEALAVAGEHPETRMFTAADFGIDKIDALFRKLDAEPDVRADAIAGGASAAPAAGIEEDIRDVAMRPITREEVATENARQQAANRYTNIDPYVEETGIDKVALRAIKARLNGEFDHPALKGFGPLADTFSDVIRIAEDGIRNRIHATPNDSDTVYVVFSQQEFDDAGAGFWSNGNGWTDLENATRFSQAEHGTLRLPEPRDAQWVEHAAAEQLVSELRGEPKP